MISPSSPELTHWQSEDEQDWFIEETSATQGSHGPFYPVYRNPDGTHRYGWVCSNCDSMETLMDPMGRVECASCSNTRKPTTWDASYL